MRMRGALRNVIWCLLAPMAVIVIFFSALVARSVQAKSANRIVWGSDPVSNNRYWARAMRQAGYDSQTFTTSIYSQISSRDEWDELLDEKFKLAPAILRPVIAFCYSLFRYDVFVISFNGYFLGATPLRRLQSAALKLANKKIVVIAYGADYYEYRSIRSTVLIHALMLSYPAAARRQERVASQVRYWSARADAVIPSMMGPDGGGRWDVLAPSVVHIDTDLWMPARRSVSQSDGKTGVVKIAHAPNHRGFKGTEFVVNAVNALRDEGLNVELMLLEGLKNEVVRETLCNNADILVEQLNATGHGLNAIEGMAAGLVVVANLEDEAYTRPMRRWSFLQECPIVSASPENIVDVLRVLVTRPDLRNCLGVASRAYAKKYHGLDSAVYLFRNVIEFVSGRQDSLLNMYHPLTSEWSRRMPPVRHPLKNSRIVD